MKKLLTTAAVCGLVVAASPAQADLDLEIGGYMKGYVFYSDQDDDSDTARTTESRSFDIIRNTEIHLSGETTLDNGLTVGFHTETEADGNATGAQDSFDVQESYAYFSGGWGRVNFGAEDGAAYLLQVAVPSADSNLDGIRQYVNPVNFTFLQDAAIGGGSLDAALDVNGTRGGVDYDQDISGYADKLTYLSPIMNGFQLGFSYTPDIADTADEDAEGVDDAEGVLGEVYDAAFRYEGMFNNVGVTLGAGYTHNDLEKGNPAPLADTELADDRTAWNVGLDLDIGPFGIGVTYLEDDYGEVVKDDAVTKFDDEETLVVGIDYTTGPFKLGASFMDIDNLGSIEGNTPAGAAFENGVEANRYTGGVVYTYGPGMTFRGSISHLELDNVSDVTGGDEVDATTVLLGTQINF